MFPNNQLQNLSNFLGVAINPPPRCLAVSSKKIRFSNLCKIVTSLLPQQSILLKNIRQKS